MAVPVHHTGRLRTRRMVINGGWCKDLILIQLRRREVLGAAHLVYTRPGLCMRSALSIRRLRGDLEWRGRACVAIAL